MSMTRISCQGLTGVKLFMISYQGLTRPYHDHEHQELVMSYANLNDSDPKKSVHNLKFYIMVNKNYLQQVGLANAWRLVSNPQNHNYQKMPVHLKTSFQLELEVES